MIPAHRFIFFAALALNNTAFADTKLLLDSPKLSTAAGDNNLVYIRELQTIDANSNSVIGFRAGTTSIRNFKFSNNGNRFSYENASAAALSIYWETTPLAAIGHWGMNAGIGFATYAASLKLQEDKTASTSSVTPARVSIFPSAAGITYIGDFHSATKWLMPVASLGIDYNLYLQSGDNGGDQMTARGGAWSLRRSVGLRHSLHWLGVPGTQLSGDYILHSRLTETGPSLEGRSILFGLMAHI